MLLHRIFIFIFVCFIGFSFQGAHAAILKYSIAGNAIASWPGGPHGLYRDQIAEFYGVENPVTGFSYDVPIQVELVMDQSAVPAVLNGQPYDPGDSLDGFGEALYRGFMISASVSLNGHIFNNIRAFSTEINEQEALIQNAELAYGYAFEYHNAQSIVGSSLFSEETIPLDGADDIEVTLGLLRFRTSFLFDSVDNLLIPSEINYQDAFAFGLSFNIDTCRNVDCSLRDTVIQPAISDINDITHFSITAVPVPAAVYLFGSGILGLVGFLRSK